MCIYLSVTTEKSELGTTPGRGGVIILRLAKGQNIQYAADPIVGGLGEDVFFRDLFTHMSPLGGDVSSARRHGGRSRENPH